MRWAGGANVEPGACVQGYRRDAVFDDGAPIYEQLESLREYIETLKVFQIENNGMLKRLEARLRDFEKQHRVQP